MRVYGIILLPGAIFVTAVSVLLNVVLRNRYLAYVVSIGTAAGLLYLYNLGYNDWTYNPLMYRLWTYADLSRTTTIGTIVWRRFFLLGISAGCLVLARIVFEGKATRLITNDKGSERQR